MRILLLVLAASAAHAQVNTERLRRAVEADGVTVSVDASAAFATGNTEYLRLGLGGRTDVRAGDDMAFVVGRFDLSRADGRSFLDRSFLHGRYTHALAPRAYLETFAQIERNRQQRLVSRTLFGIGGRYELIDRDSLGLALGVTPMFEYEELDDELGEAPSGVVRVSSYASARWTLSEATAISTTTYVQPSVQAPSDLRVLHQTALSVGITRSVRLRVQANVRYDSRPPDGVERTDVSIENGLVLALPLR